MRGSAPSARRGRVSEAASIGNDACWTWRNVSGAVGAAAKRVRVISVVAGGVGGRASRQTWLPYIILTWDWGKSSFSRIRENRGGRWGQGQRSRAEDGVSFAERWPGSGTSGLAPSCRVAVVFTIGGHGCRYRPRARPIVSVNQRPAGKHRTGRQK